jgi:hypothetical protein
MVGWECEEGLRSFTSTPVPPSSDEPWVALIILRSALLEWIWDPATGDGSARISFSVWAYDVSFPDLGV